MPTAFQCNFGSITMRDFDYFCLGRKTPFLVSVRVLPMVKAESCECCTRGDFQSPSIQLPVHHTYFSICNLKPKHSRSYIQSCANQLLLPPLTPQALLKADTR